jgi:hypothetical protein
VNFALLGRSRAILLAFIVAAVSQTVFAQSTDQNFPTPITSSEVSGTIRARDIGDARLTTYYYAFNGGQGDIFLNAVTSNFAGDIDVFTADTLQPLAKMVSYPESANSETGRLIYLRKPARLLLRIEGRSPNDSPATFKIKFAGSFIALQGKEEEKAPEVARTDTEESGVRVNSVGTKIPAPPVEVKKIEPERTAKAAAPPQVKPSPESAVTPEKRVTKSAPEVKTVFGGKSSAKAAVKKADPGTSETPPAKAGTAGRQPANTRRPPRVVVEETRVDPFASINLVVELKSGDVIQRPMSEILRFSVEKGMLTVVFKDGKITRYPILDVSSFTMR